MVIGNLQPTGIRPRFADRLLAQGINLGEQIFNVGRWA